MRVMIIGAGIGGLTLAQGLRREGVDVVVHDRDPEPAATGGYRLHLDAAACAALARRLRPEHYQALLASSASRAALRRFSFVDHRLRTIGVDLRRADEEVLMISRVPLRELLCHGLDDALVFGSEFVDHHVDPDGRVTARFADGRTDTADLLVGADGVGSRVAAALAGRPTSRPLGLDAVAGRTPLTADTRALLPDVLAAGPALGIEPGGVIMFLHVHDPQRPQVDPATCGAVPARGEPPTLVWGLNAATGAFPDGVATRDGAALIATATTMLHRWSPEVRALVAAADPARTAWFRFHAVDPDAELTPWPAGPVTALGDAVHAMPPTGGRAAATAIRDADLLTRHLTGVAERTPLPLAVHRYQRDMAGYAADAVRESLAPLVWQRRLGGPVAAGVARAALPVLTGARRLLVGRRSQPQTTVGVGR